MSRRFSRRVEDFKCVRCGAHVTGDGFTNHCPHCLVSLHVDVQPGDRAERCGGLMMPIRVEKKGDQLVLVHRCSECGAIRRCRTADNDDFEQLLNVMRRDPGPGS